MKHTLLSPTTFSAVMAGLAMALLSTGVQGVTVANASFESPDASGGDLYVDGSDSWIGFNSVFTTAGQAHTGTQSLKIFGPFEGGGAGAVQYFPAMAGETWIANAYGLVSSFDVLDGFDFGVLKIEFFNSAGNFVSGNIDGVDSFSSNPIDSFTPTDTWTLLGVGTAPAPAGTASARLVLVKVDVNGGGGGSIFFDDVTAETVMIPEPGAFALLGMSGLMLLGRRRRR